MLITACNKKSKQTYVYFSAFVSTNHILLPGCVKALIVASLRRQMCACKYLTNTLCVHGKYIYVSVDKFISFVGCLKRELFNKNVFCSVSCFHRHVISYGSVEMNVYVHMREKVSEKNGISINRLTTSKHISNWSKYL